MMKRWGGRPGLLIGRRQVRHETYPTIADAVRGLEKNGFAQGARSRHGAGRRWSASPSSARSRRSPRSSPWACLCFHSSARQRSPSSRRPRGSSPARSARRSRRCWHRCRWAISDGVRGRAGDGARHRPRRPRLARDHVPHEAASRRPARHDVVASGTARRALHFTARCSRGAAVRARPFRRFDRCCASTPLRGDLRRRGQLDA